MISDAGFKGNAMVKELQELEKKWSERLEECQYVGELALDEEELDRCMGFLSLLIADQKRCPFDAVITVLAVNTAYFDYDNSGFWIHFCSRIGVCNDSNSQRYFGRKIENCLRKHNLMRKDRWGGFRYVGAILEQSGVTNRYLPKFAQILNSAANVIGWNGLLTVGYKDYEDLIPDHGISFYLSEFLKSEVGWQFVRDVAREISHVRRGILNKDYLASLRGYRPGFWASLLKFLEPRTVTPPPEPQRFPPVPKLVFHVELGRPVILFDQEHVRKEAYRLDGQQVSTSAHVLRDPRDFSSSYRIALKSDDGEWMLKELKGWDPDEICFALFEPSKGYVDSIASVRPGIYQLVVHCDIDVPAAFRTAHLGLVEIGTESFRGWEIHINSADDLKFLPLPFVGPGPPACNFLSWQDNENRLKGQCDVREVFTGHLPSVRIQQANLFRTGSLILIVDFGTGPKAQSIQEGPDEIAVDIVSPLPSQGEIWVEAVGRFREFSGESVLDALSFCLLPECVIEWPTDLFENEEKPQVRLRGDDGVTLDLTDCKRIESASGIWEVPPGVTVVEGVLQAGSVSVALAHRIFRAEMRNYDDFATNVLEKQDLLRGIKIVAVGLPNAEASIELATAKGAIYGLANLGLFDARGEHEFSSLAFRDTLAPFDEPAGRFGIRDRTRLVLTETRFLNCESIRQRLILDPDDLEWCEVLHQETAKSFETISRVIRGTVHHVALRICNHFPRPLVSWMAELLLCGTTFDGILLQGDSAATLERLIGDENPAVAAGLSWYERAREYYEPKTGSETQVSAAQLVGEFDRLEWRPPVDRWLAEFNKVSERLRQETDLLGLVREWTDHVRGGKHTSRIYRMPVGQQLTSAWKAYLTGDFEKAFRLATAVIEKHARTPVFDLAYLLREVTLLRTCRYRQMAGVESDSCHEKLRPHLATLCHLAKILSGEQCRASLSGSGEAISVDSLPLREQDLPLLGRAFMDPSFPGITDSVTAVDWLFLVAHYCFCLQIRETRAAEQVGSMLRNLSLDDSIAPAIYFILEREYHA